MFHLHVSSRLRSLVVVFFAFFFMVGQPQAKAQDTSPGLDIFSGFYFNFKDMDFKNQYEVLIHLTPGFKWNMGNHWQLAGQVIVPVVNTFGDRYKYVQMGAFNISKELRIKNLYLKPTVGVFDMGYYGADMKAFLPLCNWFALEGQAGYIGPIIVDPVFFVGKPDYFVWAVGGDIYLSRWNTQFRGTLGKYLNFDFGCEAEAMRHFNHTTVSIYGRWNAKYGLDGGFRFVIALPPYHRKHRTVNFRPASNYGMSYTVMYKVNANCMYHTDPEENERHGWFSRDFLQWGSHTMDPDFIITNQSNQQ